MIRDRNNGKRVFEYILMPEKKTILGNGATGFLVGT